MDKGKVPTNYGKGLHIAHLKVRSMFGGKKFDMLKMQIELSGFDVVTTVPLAVGYGALNLWVRSLDR